MKKIFGVFAVMICAFLSTLNDVDAAADFDAYLTDGKLVINGVEPKDEFEAYERFESYFKRLNVSDYQIAPASCDYTFTTCYLVYHLGEEDQEEKEIEVVYNYDENVKKVVDNLIKNMGDKTTFSLTDMEIINYFLYGTDSSNLSSFSLDFRKAIGYKNFELDVRGGDTHPFYKENIGVAEFIYNNTVYSYIDGFGVGAKQIIYVEDDAVDIKSSIEKRILDTFGDVNIEVTKGNTIASFLESEKNMALEEYNSNSGLYMSQGYNSALEYAEYYMNINYNNEDSFYHFMVEDNVLEDYYILVINGKKYNFAVIKDSSKINNSLEYLSVDTSSNVEVNTSGILPLDTLIQVAKLTSGEEYDRIIKILNTSNLDIFDLKLFAKSTGNYITKLDDGNFEVKIPIKDEFKGKDLVVYYVTEDGKVEEHNVVVNDNYAVFKTNHFSIYSLAEKSITKEEVNPKTLDNIILYFVLGIVSLVCLCAIIFVLIKKRKDVR